MRTKDMNDVLDSAAQMLSTRFDDPHAVELAKVMSLQIIASALVVMLERQENEEARQEFLAIATERNG